MRLTSLLFGPIPHGCERCVWRKKLRTRTTRKRHDRRRRFHLAKLVGAYRRLVLSNQVQQGLWRRDKSMAEFVERRSDLADRAIELVEHIAAARVAFVHASYQDHTV